MTIADFVNSTGIKVIPLNPKTKAPICKWKNHPEYFTNNIKKLRNYWKAGFTAFAFIPARYGLVVLDIDIKNNINGLDNLKRIIADKEIIFPYDIYKNYFYVRTPSGGLHYYWVKIRLYALSVNSCSPSCCKL